MSELKIYSVSDRYIEYLEQSYSNIYSNKVANRTHTRKYLGVVLQINDYLYYAPYHLLKSLIIKLQEMIK